MYSTNSDYAVNKNDPEAIVCRSVTGGNVRLTHEDFASDEEFEKWKHWSDNDYKNQKAGIVRSMTESALWLLPIFLTGKNTATGLPPSSEHTRKRKGRNSSP